LIFSSVPSLFDSRNKDHVIRNFQKSFVASETEAG